MAAKKKRAPSDRAILREFSDFVRKGPKRVIDLPPWRPDQEYRRVYGHPSNVFAVVMKAAEDPEQGGGIEIRMDPPPQSWKELRAEQRAQFGIYGSDYMPWSRGYAA